MLKNSLPQTETSAFERPKKTGLLLSHLGIYREEMRNAAKSPDLKAVINAFIILNEDLKQRPPVTSGGFVAKAFLNDKRTYSGRAYAASP